MRGADIEFKPGRTDVVDDSKLPSRGRLPDGSKGSDHIRFIFNRMGFNDQEVVALSGAHKLGRCHSDRSGFEGTWVNNPTRFSNQYFKLMKSLEWKYTTLPNGIEQFVHRDEDLDDELMMLPTDIALLDDPSFSSWVTKYANDQDLFFSDFAKVFAKLTKLGIQQDSNGKITNTDNVKGGYHSAPQKETVPGAPQQSKEDAEPLKMRNQELKAKP